MIRVVDMTDSRFGEGGVDVGLFFELVGAFRDRTGYAPDAVRLRPDQQDAAYNFMQSQVRFSPPGPMGVFLGLLIVVAEDAPARCA